MNKLSPSSKFTEYHRRKVPDMVWDVVWWLVNMAVSEMSILRMRACGQLAININPIYTSPYISRAPPRSLCTSDSIQCDLSSEGWPLRQACTSDKFSSF